MAFVNPSTPNLADFQTFLTTEVQIPTSAWPAGGITASPWPQYALDGGIDLVLTGEGFVSGTTYTLAVYNCATHILFQITPDQTGQSIFTNLRSRQGLGLVQPSTGLVQAATDQGTAGTLIAPRWGDGLTVDQLDFYKSFWGRRYLAFIQKFGPTIWGLT